MGTVHDLINQHGKQGALQLHDRQAVEAAAAFMSSEECGVGFVYSGWCQAALPHKKLPDDQTWQIRSEHVNLVVAPGYRSSDIGSPEKVGVPYGSRARLILIYAQSEAVRTGSREIALGGSMRQWLTRMGVKSGGNSVNLIRDQTERISRCSLTFDVKSQRLNSVGRMNIFDKAVFSDGTRDNRVETSFPQVAHLSELFFEQLTNHPVPLDEAAVRALSNNSMALDLYAWLGYRLHALRGVTSVSWVAAKGQFGAGFSSMRHFRETFIVNLDLARAVYPDARVEITKRGVDLHPSRPPVLARAITIGRPAVALKPVDCR